MIPFLAFPADVRRVVYPTNTIEALHRQIGKTIKTRGHFPTEEAARKSPPTARDPCSRVAWLTLKSKEVPMSIHEPDPERPEPEQPDTCRRKNRA